MKKVLSAFALALLLVGCAKEYDDSELKNRVTTLETKVGNLEAQMTAANKVALGQYVQKVEKTEEGVTVTYGDGTVVALKISGGAGAGTLGVVQKDGLLYWAVDGVVLQHEGKDLLVSQVSNIYVEDGKLYADIAGNKTELGGFSGGASLQDGIFKNIEVTAENVVLTLSDNSTVNIPIGSAFKLVIAKTQYQVTTTDPFDVPYTVNAKINGTEVDIFTDANYKATVEADKFVITPKAVAEGSALAYADSKVGLTSIVKLNFGAEGEADYANVTDEPADPGNNIDYIAESADAAVDVHIVSNVSLDKNSIQPQVDWISVSEVKANNYTITLVLEDNPTDQIRTGEVWVLEAGTGNKLQTIVVAQKAKEEVPEVKNWYNPQGWNKVFDMSSYKTNSTFMLGDGITLTPGSLTLQWKFYANAWNDHKFNGKDGAGNQLFCNRLGEFANADESQSVLFRFSNDGEADGQLCLNAGALGLGQAQVRKGDKPYVWPVGEWAVMTLVSDGNALSVYCNDELIATYEVNAPASWDLKRFDLSMTWDDGSNWPLRQAFNGYTAYARVWSRALAASEIAATLCEVDANAEGLEIDWKFDGADEKAVLNVAGKNAGMDLDFTDCWDGNGNARDNSEAAAAAWTPLAGSAVDGLCYTTSQGGSSSEDPEEPQTEDKNPAGWEKVFNMADYNTNSTFIWSQGLSLNPSAVTLQWKFYANKWNNHKFQDKDGQGNTLYANRLGEFANADESKSVLFRFSNDGDVDGQLCLNAGALGLSQVQVGKDGKPYAWPAQEWVVMTIVSDGSKVHVYQDNTLLSSYDATPGASWNLERVDLSMTWDDGSNWPLAQAFNGYTAYIRVWSKALAASEIEATLCEIPAEYKDGLEACWNFDGSTDKWIENSVEANADYVLDFTSCFDGNGNAKDKGDAAAAAWTTLAGNEMDGICHIATITGGGEEPTPDPDPEPDPDPTPDPEPDPDPTPDSRTWYTPTGWDKVFNMADYNTNSTFIWSQGLSLNPSAVTLQWKFYANKWNNHKFQDKDGQGNTLYANRLGEFANADESKSVLFRFSNDGDVDGQLCLNAGALGLSQVQVGKDGKPYAWPAQEWVVMTIVSDGSKVHVYENDTLLSSYDATPGASWDLERVDLSMTWDDGSNWPRSQAFNGYTAFIRVWSKALAASEIAATLCEVPAQHKDGLEACWNFDGSTDKWVENSVEKDVDYALDFTSCFDGNGNAKDKGDAAAAAWTALSGSTLPGICYVVE